MRARQNNFRQRVSTVGTESFCYILVLIHKAKLYGFRTTVYCITFQGKGEIDENFKLFLF